MPTKPKIIIQSMVVQDAIMKSVSN